MAEREGLGREVFGVEECGLRAPFADGVDGPAQATSVSAARPVTPASRSRASARRRDISVGRAISMAGR
ncbi:MAG: hypothetical protein ABI130_08050 [Leifsonia sp.]